MSNGDAAGIIILLFLFIIAVVVVSIIAWVKIFNKAGEPGWKVIIPVYGQYMQYRIADATGLFFATIGLSAGSSVISSIVSLSAANSYSYRYSSSPSPLLGILLVGVGIAAVVIQIIYCVKLAQAFGKSGGFAAGLFFLNTVFICILAFGDAKYVGYNGLSAVPSSTGSWTCPNCNTSNPTFRGTCDNCGSAKPSAYDSPN